MDNDRLKILTMVEEGKITCSEAVDLLNALHAHDENIRSAKKTSIADEGISQTIEDAIEGFKSHIPSISDELSKQLNCLDSKLHENIVPDIEKLSGALKLLEKELKKLTSSIIEGISKDAGSLMPEISKEMAELYGTSNKNGGMLYRGIEELQKKYGSMPIDTSELSAKLSGIYGSITQNSLLIHDYNMSWEKKIDDPSITDLHFECINGSVSIEEYEGSVMEIEVNCKTSEASLNKVISIIDEPEMYGVKTINSGNTMVFLYIKMPSTSFRRICLSTNNSRVKVRRLSCRSIICNASDGRVELSDIKCDSIEGNVSGGKTELSDICADSIFMKCTDSPTKIEGMQCSHLEISALSGGITLNSFENISGESEIDISSDGGDVNIMASSLHPSAGIYVDASSKNGDLILEGIPHFTYNVNEINRSGINRIIGKTSCYDAARDRIKISVRAADASVRIV